MTCVPLLSSARKWAGPGNQLLMRDINVEKAAAHMLQLYCHRKYGSIHRPEPTKPLLTR